MASRPKTGQRPIGTALNSMVTVVDRPMTQQGLGGMKTAAKGQRQVHDRTYYLGLVRSKINELNTETGRLNKEIENVSEENSSYLTYEKRAEILASEIKDLQGELGDYNTLVDKLTTDEDIQDVEFDLNDLRAANEREARKIEDLFEVRQKKEEQIKQVETELDQEKRMADNLVNDMDTEMRQKYFRLKDMNEHMLKQLESGQQELDVLNSKTEGLNELNELEMKRDSLVEEAKSTTNEFREKIESLQEEIHQLDMDIEENQGERNQKYKELKKREETMDEFLQTFEQTKSQEHQRIGELEQNNMGRFQALPSQNELAEMKEDLAFKEGEMKKSEFTSVGLGQENEKLRDDLEKVEQLEDKINTELVMLKEKIATMETELVTFRDLDSLRRKSEEKKQLGNLERKWQHHEQNNFCNYRPISKRVFSGVTDYNQQLQTQMANNPSM
ncbi:IFT74-like protein [Mya arenaria]|uniref:IFT74-like protein n=1 Tax=Mya arenaria TaxID=6604 RepID=A0ABY7FQ60_MYAAR|nr:IFT74-like protein [Mya arenaria]